MARDTVRLTVICSFLLAAAGGILALAGPLNPPGGPVSSTGKTTQEVFDKVVAAEPRTAIIAANTPGDSDSMFTISQSGSYYLTADVYVASGKSGIKINNLSAPNVTIDLKGFTIHGGAGTLDGIRTTSVPGGTTLRIYNGATTGMAGNGVNVYAETLDLTEVAVQFSGLNGISYSGNAISIDHCRSFWNTGDGFNSSSAANISGCVSDSNNGDGFEIGPGRISGCTTTNVGGRGIVAASSCQIVDCAVNSILDGISIGFYCTVERNKVATSSTRIAIHATGSGNRIDGNEVAFGLVGIQSDTASGNTVVRNFARGNTTAYNVPVANFFGPVVTSGGSLGTASPWANFSY